MSTRIHERRSRRDIPAQRARGRIKPTKYDRLSATVNAACTVWLFENCPGYREEKERRGIMFGRHAK